MTQGLISLGGMDAPGITCKNNYSFSDSIVFEYAMYVFLKYVFISESTCALHLCLLESELRKDMAENLICLYISSAYSRALAVKSVNSGFQKYMYL